MVHRCWSASAGRLQPECALVALPGGSAEIVFPGALAELSRGGLALFSPLAGGVNGGGFPELVGVAGPPAGGVGCDWGASPPLSGDVDPAPPPALAVWPAAPAVPLPEASGALLPAALTLSSPPAGREAIGDA
jgi:hypothetical protein